MSDGTTGERERLPRGVKRDSDYAVLNTGQLIPDVESPKQATTKKMRPPVVCVWCHEPGDVVLCVNCDSPFHRVCALKRDPSATALCAKCLPRGPRYRLPTATTLDDAVRLLREAKNIVVLVGAGISVSCGIPDFRSENGIYTIIQKMGLDLPEPEALFDIDFFRSDPFPFFHFAMDFFQGTYTPSRTHRFLRELYDAKKLLRVYSQNIDGLEADAGVPNVVACHGSLATASCMLCGKNVPTSTLRLPEVVAANAIPRCDCGGVMKPDITFFGQALAPTIRESLAMDAPKVDLLIVIGTSLQVSPVSDIPAYLPRDVPQLLINMESVVARGTDGFDVELLGACDTVVEYLHKAMAATNDADAGASTNDAADTLAGAPHHHEPNVYCFGNDACYWNDDDDDDEKGPLVDAFFQCDGCAEEVDCEEASRFSCTTCFDYDLCEACHASEDIKASHYDGQHAFALH